ncbi:hypothetical protein C0J52_27695, partial [Blattella germanica]
TIFVVVFLDEEVNRQFAHFCGEQHLKSPLDHRNCERILHPISFKSHQSETACYWRMNKKSFSSEFHWIVRANVLKY